MKLSAKALCPLHRRRDCCGRAEMHRYAQPKHKQGIWTQVRAGVWRAPDGREKCSDAEMRRRKDSKLRSGEVCAACGEKFSDYRDVELSHRVGKGIGGGTRDDSMGNLVLLHKSANRDQGSMDLETYLATKWKPEVCRG